MLLNHQELRKFIEEYDLIKNYIDIDAQLTPNGFDLTANEILKFTTAGKIDFSNSEREIANTVSIETQKINKDDKYGWWDLSSGVYKIKTNEIVNIPKNLAGFAFPRSSLLRMGVHIQNGVWDGGFEGQSEFLLKVENTDGAMIKENARLNHIVFMKMKETQYEYEGKYNQ